MLENAHIGLKVDVDTLRGTREGVPRLAALLKKLKLDATFYFSVGPDHTGRALRRVFRKGFAQKVARTSVLKHYGLKTLLYGVLLPGPDIGIQGGDVMRGVPMPALSRTAPTIICAGTSRGGRSRRCPNRDCMREAVPGFPIACRRLAINAALR